VLRDRHAAAHQRWTLPGGDVRPDGGDPGPYAIVLGTQPQFSQRYSVGNDGQNEPDPTTPDEYGGVWFRNVRAYQCTSIRDPVCTRLANLNVGQAPRV
jgi:hypothetical protein